MAVKRAASFEPGDGAVTTKKRVRVTEPQHAVGYMPRLSLGLSTEAGKSNDERRAAAEEPGNDETDIIW